MNVQRTFPTKPLDTLYADVIGPLPLTKHKNRFALVLVDTASKWVVARPMKTATASNITDIIMRDVILQYGPPRLLAVDNATNFSGRELKQFCERYRIQLNFIPKYTPMTNETERYNRTVKQCLAIFCTEQHTSWDEVLPYVVYALRTAPSEVTGLSPARILYGRELRSFHDLGSPFTTSSASPFDSSSDVANMDVEFARISEHLKRALAKSKEQQAKHYNLRRRDVTYEEGMLVWRRNYALSDGAKRTTSKFEPKFIGPFKVIKKYSDTQYELATQDGESIGRWHIQDLRPCV